MEPKCPKVGDRVRVTDPNRLVLIEYNEFSDGTWDQASYEGTVVGIEEDPYEDQLEIYTELDGLESYGQNAAVTLLFPGEWSICPSVSIKILGESKTLEWMDIWEGNHGREK